MKKIWSVTGIYAAAHFAVDLGCAYAVFSRCDVGAVGFLVYNFCAFAMQLPLGILADQVGKNWHFAALGIIMVTLIVCLPYFGLPGCLVLGLGNGLFHIGGGLDVLNLSPKAAPLGVFVSPGALGLYLGTLWGKQQGNAWPVQVLLLVCGLAIFLFCRKNMPENAPFSLPSKKTVLPAVLLTAVVMLRSFVGMAAQFPWKTGWLGLLAVLMVVLGKTVGGFASDRWGVRNTAALSLLLAAGCYLFSQNPMAGLAGLFLFNMTMPITLWALAQKMPGCKGLSFGLLTFGLFLGFLPTYLGVGTIGGGVLAVLSLASLGLLRKGVA